MAGARTSVISGPSSGERLIQVRSEATDGQAAAYVFAPQATGYSQEGGVDAAKASSVIEVLAKPIASGRA